MLFFFSLFSPNIDEYKSCSIFFSQCQTTILVSAINPFLGLRYVVLYIENTKKKKKKPPSFLRVYEAMTLFEGGEGLLPRYHF